MGKFKSLKQYFASLKANLILSRSPVLEIIRPLDAQYTAQG